jgi:hypothetical protein
MRPKIIPQPRVRGARLGRFGQSEGAMVRNGSQDILLIKKDIFPDCKSAYAGSIPTSASTLKNPVD